MDHAEELRTVQFLCSPLSVRSLTISAARAEDYTGTNFISFGMNGRLQ